MDFRAKFHMTNDICIHRLQKKQFLKIEIHEDILLGFRFFKVLMQFSLLLLTF